jgi:UDP-3-O-[3-hydroxymyristoyl] N-acetylglucosamine deacetylase
MIRQKTIARSVEVVGIGLHKGEPIRLRLEPMDADSGIIFYRDDLAVTIPLSPQNVVNTQMATVIGNEKATISTIEHFLSAVYAYGIDNLRVILDGSEMPVMDGSAISFCLLLDEAGTRELDESKKIICVKKEVEVRDGEKFARLSPSSTASFDFKIKFTHPVIGEQEESFELSKSAFVNDIARARTFGFVKDIQYLQSQNLALGATLKNAIGLDEHKILNPEGLRFENEFVRHKILDALGDLMVSGHNILGSYSAYAGSHKLNYMLTKALLADASNYEMVAVKRLKSREIAKNFA